MYMVVCYLFRVMLKRIWVGNLFLYLTGSISVKWLPCRYAMRIGLKSTKLIWDRSIYSKIEPSFDSWHDIVPVFLKSYTDLQEICSICLLVSEKFYYINNNKNNVASKYCKFLANLCKFSEILEQCHVKWWLKYWNNRSVSWRLSCTYIEWFCEIIIRKLKDVKV